MSRVTLQSYMSSLICPVLYVARVTLQSYMRGWVRAVADGGAIRNSVRAVADSGPSDTLSGRLLTVGPSDTLLSIAQRYGIRSTLFPPLPLPRSLGHERQYCAYLGFHTQVISGEGQYQAH